MVCGVSGEMVSVGGTHAPSMPYHFGVIFTPLTLFNIYLILFILPNQYILSYIYTNTHWMAVQLNQTVNKWVQTVKGAGILFGAAALYMLRLEWHYKKHPEARQDGWLPLEWQSHNEIASEYHRMIEKGALASASASASASGKFNEEK